MFDPCIALDGNVYERSEITQFVHDFHMSPITWEPMDEGNYATDQDLRELIVSLCYLFSLHSLLHTFLSLSLSLSIYIYIYITLSLIFI